MSQAYQNTYKEFRIHLLQEEKTVREVAGRLGISVQYLADVLKGNRPGRTVRERLVKECGVPAHLVEGVSQQAA